MQQKTYDVILMFIRENTYLSKIIVVANSILTALGYIAFPFLIVLQLISGNYVQAIKTLIVCAVGYCVVSAFRHVVNAPRPYEELSIEPLVNKNTQGKSFPSRHAFCMLLIAFAWVGWFLPAGIVLLIFGVVMGVLRVLMGLHWPQDILGAIAFAGLFGVMLLICL